MYDDSDRIDDVVGSKPLSDEDFNLFGRPNIVRATELLAEFLLDYDLFSTWSHQGIFDILLSHAHSLSRNEYYDTMGECSATLVGAKGIGKTRSLRTFVKLVPKIFKNICTIYINFNNIFATGSKLQSSIISIVTQKLSELEIEIPETDDPKKALLSLLVDELDQLYKSIEISSLCSLHDLVALGNQSTGTVSVIVCGSSAMMEALITCNADENIRREFPLLNKGAPSLNGTKYLTRRVYSTLPTDLDAVASITHTPNNEEHKAWLRFVAFAGGCSARTTGRILRDHSMSGALLEGLSPDSAFTGHNTLAVSDLSLLRTSILKATYKKNKKLLKKLMDASTCTIDIDKVAIIEWEKLFMPLTFKEVKCTWKALIRRGKVSAENSNNLVYYLFHLADRCWLTLSGVANSAPRYIYPYSMFHLMKPCIREELLPSVQDNLMAVIKQNASGVGKYLSDPKLAAVVPAALIAGGCCSIM